jgi:hypothetical protein
MILDRFDDEHMGVRYPIQDEPEVYSECANPKCMKDIYVGDYCYDYYGSVCCDDLSCLVAITESKLIVAGEYEEVEAEFNKYMDSSG